MFDAQNLDIYDDKGALLRSHGVSLGSLPEFVKVAKQVDQNYDGNCFALVLVQDGRAMKKYATYDAGNTWMSGVYFEAHHDQLPLGAEKIAAQNLLYAFSQHGLEPPSAIEKLAGEITAWPPESNVYSGPMHRDQVAPSFVESAGRRFALEKTASQSYPLDTPSQVMKAQEYYEEYENLLSPGQRREFATNVRSAVEEMGLPLKEKVASYSGRNLNPFLQSYLTMRDVELSSREAPQATRERLEKLAASSETMRLDVFADELETFDRESGLDSLWGHEIPDPWLTTFSNLEKVASQRWVVGTVEVNEDQIKNLAGHHQRLKDVFGETFAMRFAKNPAVVFDTLPADLKETVARMATDVHKVY